MLFLDAWVRYGLILLLIWTPLAFGAVHAWAVALLEVHVFLLVAAWMGQHLLGRRQGMAPCRQPPEIVLPRLALPFALLLILLGFQIIPLPPPVLRFLSPSTHELYTHSLPGWPEALRSGPGLPAPASAWRPLSLHAYATRLALFKLLAYAALFVLLINSLRSRRSIRLVCKAIVGVAAGMALLGIVQKLSGTSAIYWWRETGYAGFFGPFINRNHFAGYQTMAILLGLGLLLAQPSSAPEAGPRSWRSRLLRWLSIFTQGRGLLVFALAVMTGGVFFSLSRGGVFSFLLGLLGFGGLLLTRRSGRRREVWVLTLTAMAAMILWLGIAPLLLRIEALIYGSDTASWGGRWPVFQGTWELIKDFPWFGVGYEAFAVIFPRYQPPGVEAGFLYAHNDFLQLLAETGVAGFVPLVGGVALLIGHAMRRWRQRHDRLVRVLVPACLAALGAIMVHALVDFGLRIPANALLYTVVLALAYACIRLPGRGEAPRQAADASQATQRQPRRVAVLPWVIIGVMLWLTYGAVRVTVADLLYPQQRVLRPSHWVYQADPARRQHRLRRALTWTPDNPYYWRTLATLEAQTARQQLRQHASSPFPAPRLAEAALLRAAAAYRRALAFQPSDPYTQLGRLVVLQRLAGLEMPGAPRMLTERQTLATRIASLAPAVPRLQYDLGMVLLAWDSLDLPRHRRGAASVPFFRQAIRLDPAYSHQVLQAYRGSLPPARALPLFASTIPKTPQGQVRAAQVLERHFWPQARLHYLAALALAPSDPAIARAYATSLQRHGAFAAAREVWERLKRLTPDDATVYLGLAEAYAGLDNHQGLVQTLHELIDRFPRQAVYYQRLAEAYRRRGASREAEAVWKRATLTLPHDPTAYVGLARLYESRQDYPAAMTMMQRALSVAPDNPHYHRHLARLYAQYGDSARALQALRQLAAIRPGDARVLYQLGRYFHRQGEHLQALVYYRRAMRLAPEHRKFRQAVRQLETRLNKRSDRQP